MTKILYMDFSDSWHNKTTVAYMIVFFIIYAITYRVLRRKIQDKPPEYICRLLTFAHGLFSSIVCLHYVCLPALNFYQVESIPCKLILSHSMGYFTFDIIWCFVHKESFIVKFHHVVTCAGLIYYSFKLEHQYINIYALGLTEFTNPFLQTRWYLKYHGMRDSLAFKIIEGAFILCFFYIRIFVFTYYAYISWTSPKFNFTADDLFFITLGLIVGYMLSWQMFGYIMYQLRKSKSKNKKEEKYEQ